MANQKALVADHFGSLRPYHIGDMRSRTGYSGSPVFCYRNFGSDLAAAARQTTTGDPRMHFVGFFGVHCGQTWDRIHVRKAKAGERVGDPILEGDKLDIQSAMTIIVPAWEISSLLDHGTFAQARKEREKGGQGKWARLRHIEHLTGRR